jgi:hypothetical protein
VLERDVRDRVLGHRVDLGRELRERGEEGPEPGPPALEPGERGDLLLGLLEAGLHRVGMTGEHPPGLRGLHAGAAASHELGPELALQQRDLARHRRLRQPERLPGGRERPLLEHRPQRRELRRVEHAHSL